MIFNSSKSCCNVQIYVYRASVLEFRNVVPLPCTCLHLAVTLLTATGASLAWCCDESRVQCERVLSAF